MGRAKKIDENTWHYRGLRITRYERRWFSVGHIGTQPWSSFMDAFTLKECVQRIDERFDRANKKALAAADACKRGEPIDCPEQHLCRHGIDN